MQQSQMSISEWDNHEESMVVCLERGNHREVTPGHQNTDGAARRQSTIADKNRTRVRQMKRA